MCTSSTRCKIHLLTFSTEQVSKLLEKHMGNAYVPSIHWTSRLRGRAGLTPYEAINKTQSTFTIDDLSGSFTELLIRNGYKGATSWRRHVVYHIEVNTSEAGLDSSFCLDPCQVEKVSFVPHPRHTLQFAMSLALFSSMFSG